MGDYVPPTIAPGPAEPYELAPGVLGVALERGGRIFIPFIAARVEGSGAVGRFIDSLADRCVVVGPIIHWRLRGILARRGWCKVKEILDGEATEIWKQATADVK